MGLVINQLLLLLHLCSLLQCNKACQLMSPPKQPGDQIDHATLGVSDITFVSESQAQSNSTRQKKRTRRRKAPIYWGKRPASKRKPDVKRKLDSELDLITAEKECVENEGDDTKEDLQDEEDDLDITENGVSSVNGDVILLDSDILASELNNDDLNSESALQNESGHVSHSPERTLKNHVLFEKVPSLPNGITTEGCSEDVVEEDEHIGEESSNNLPEKELDNSVDDSSRDSAALAEDVKEKLEPLLDLLVDTTKGASIEVLERYYSALQCCVHKQRHSHDKTQLLKDLELMIKGFGQSSRTTRTS
ncbi:ATPase AAA domain-containing protein 2B [Desmophyllum pertusum]|uniref:ATPase AAA domain-containing protein 2B n=1 Tax=Desmophyllum pertusum TaxID=174260 RepID=A0A9X0CSB7_9CNID|nr:ATPase AAA domain-containing protein 2B [Desmophyllum pertusum]